MTTSNLSIVDSLIRSHFGSNLWTKITDINFFNDDRIKQINLYFKDLPVKSKLYILMALGNLNNSQFLKWKNEVESIFLRAMVEGNLLVRAIATILQQKFCLNYLTFDISLSLENFAEILSKLTSNMDEWDVSCDCIFAEYISENVINEMTRYTDGAKLKLKSRKRKFESKDKMFQTVNGENETKDKPTNIGCKLKYLPKSYQIKEQYLQKIEAECNKKRISVPIPGRNKNKPKEENSDVMGNNNNGGVGSGGHGGMGNNEISPMKKEYQLMKDAVRFRKDSEMDIKLEDIKRRLQQKSTIAKKESKVICLSLEELPPTGPKARQIMREKEKEARKLEREEKVKRLKEEREADRLQKQQEKENKKLAHQMMMEQNKKEKVEMERTQSKANTDPVGMVSGVDVGVEKEGFFTMQMDYQTQAMFPQQPVQHHHQLHNQAPQLHLAPQPAPPVQPQQQPPQQPYISSVQSIRVVQPQQSESGTNNYQIIENPTANIRIIPSQNIASSVFRSPQLTQTQIQQQNQQKSQPQIVLIQSGSQLQNNSNAVANQLSQPSYILSTNQSGVKLVRLVTNQNISQSSPQQSQPQVVRIIGSSGNQINTNSNNIINSSSMPSNVVTPTINIAHNFVTPQINHITSVNNNINTNNNNINNQSQMNHATINPTLSGPQQNSTQSVSLNHQSMQLETMKILIRYANRLTRPQKAMIVSYIAGSADGVDFNGQSSVHISSHRAINLETFQPLNVIVDAFFLMDYRTGRWSIVKQYREPRLEEDISSFDLQPSGYPPEFSMQA